MLELKHVHTRYGPVECLKGVSLTVNEGEIVALLGANGAGKTTVLKTVSGLVRPTAGEVLLGGKPIFRDSPESIVRSGVAHVPEGRKIFQSLDVSENLDLGAFTRLQGRQAGLPAGQAGSEGGMIEKDRENVFELFPVLKKRLKQKAGTLSGGEQQMLAIGRALMSRPAVLLLDEPSLGLAPILVAAIFQMIERIHRQGKTILLVEQNAHRALQVASRAYVLEIGQIVAEGKSEDIRQSPAVREAYLGGT